MSGIFSKPKMPTLPAQQNIATTEESIQTVTEEGEVARRRRRKKLLTGGRPSTILSGIKTALIKRLGE